MGSSVTMRSAGLRVDLGNWKPLQNTAHRSAGTARRTPAMVRCARRCATTRAEWREVQLRQRR
eukprot:scaffold4067_cov267-Pinguiococcus_pyrenoidosus.AAC.5